MRLNIFAFFTVLGENIQYLTIMSDGCYMIFIHFHHQVDKLSFYQWFADFFFLIMGELLISSNSFSVYWDDHVIYFH